MTPATFCCTALSLIALAIAPAHAAKPLCPEGQVYTCTGGINGVNCRCVKPLPPGEDVSPFDLIWDVSDGTTSLVQGEVVLSVLLAPDSACTIEYAIQVNRLNGESPEGRAARGLAGTLSAAEPLVVVPIDRDSTSTRLRQYVRLRGHGMAHACSIGEFLSFEISTVAYEPLGNAVLNQRNVRPNFSLVDEERVPPITVPRPAAIGSPPAGN